MKYFSINPRGLFLAYLMFVSGKTLDYYVRTEWEICSLTRHVLWSTFRMILLVTVILFFSIGIFYSTGKDLNEHYQIISVGS